MLDYSVMEGRKYIGSGWGATQWYKNILADPRVTVQTKDGVERVIARQALARLENRLRHTPGQISAEKVDKTRALLRAAGPSRFSSSTSTDG